MNGLSGLGSILIFSALGAGFIIVTLIVSRFLSPFRPNPEKNKIYESGEEPVGHHWPSINNGYFIIALLFILFEIEVILLFPVAVVFGKSENFSTSLIVWAAILGFLLVVIAGLAYAWAKGHLDWMKPKPDTNSFKGAVPVNRYTEFNKRFK